MTDISTATPPPADEITPDDSDRQHLAAVEAALEDGPPQVELSDEARAALEADQAAEGTQDQPPADGEDASDAPDDADAEVEQPAGDQPGDEGAPASSDASRATWKQHGNPEGPFWFFGTGVKTAAPEGVAVATVEAGAKGVTLLGADGQPVPHGSFGNSTKFWAVVPGGDKPDQPPAAETPKPKPPKAAPEPQTDDSPLTKEQKWALAKLVIDAAADKLYGARPPAALAAMPANSAKAQVAQWLKYLPTGGSWNEKLGDRPK